MSETEDTQVKRLNELMTKYKQLKANEKKLEKDIKIVREELDFLFDKGIGVQRDWKDRLCYVDPEGNQYVDMGTQVRHSFNEEMYIELHGTEYVDMVYPAGKPFTVRRLNTKEELKKTRGRNR